MKEELEQSGETGTTEALAAETPVVETGVAEAQADTPAETAAAVETPTAEAPTVEAPAETQTKPAKAGAAETKKKAKAEAKASAAETETKATTEAAAEQTEEPAAAPAEPPPVKNENFRWYILHAYSGFERKVRESIESRVQAFGLRERVGRVMIPTEPVTEIVNGKKRTVERVFLPGYVLVEMELDNDLWHVLKDTPKVTGFLGTGDKPVALSEEEVSSILFRSETAKDKPRMKIKFEKGEQVRITDGPFANFNGVVDEVNEDRETLKVMVTIFGRSTPVELEFGKVEKIE
jgi:transcription termination/antitermination protein NusG